MEDGIDNLDNGAEGRRGPSRGRSRSRSGSGGNTWDFEEGAY